MEYDLIQVYQVKKNQSVESILQDLKIEKTIPIKNGTTYDANGYATWLLDKGDIAKHFAFNDSKYAGTIFQIYEYFEFGRLSFGDVIPILNLPLDGKNTFDVKLERGNYYAKVYDRFRNELYTEIFILK